MTDAPAVYTAHDIPDLINTLPTLFGFRPQESLVAVATRGRRHRFGFRMRVDIPPPAQIDPLACLVVDHLRHQDAEGAVLIAVTDQQDAAQDLLAALKRELGEIELVIAARADAERYWCDEPGFPAHGIAYEMSDHHLAIVEAVAAGQQILPDREALAARFRTVEEPRRTWMIRATDTVTAEVGRQLGRRNAGELVRDAMRVLQPIIDGGLAGERLTDRDVVTLSVWLSNREVRDEFWRQISRDNAAAMLALLTQVSRTVVPPFEPPVLSLAAFAAWLTGDGTQALIAVERAIEADPHYSMAAGVLALLEGGVSPAHWGRT